MAKRGFPFQNLRVNGMRSKAYMGLSLSVVPAGSTFGGTAQD